MAVIETYEFSDAALEQRYQVLSAELRCPKCQNQNIADSNAPIAQDLRKRLYQQLEEGASDDEILDYMVARYGEFVRYRPRFSGATAILWLAPVLLLLAGAVVVLLTCALASNRLRRPHRRSALQKASACNHCWTTRRANLERFYFYLRCAGITQWCFLPVSATWRSGVDQDQARANLEWYRLREAELAEEGSEALREDARLRLLEDDQQTRALRQRALPRLATVSRCGFCCLWWRYARRYLLPAGGRTGCADYPAVAADG